MLPSTDTSLEGLLDVLRFARPHVCLLHRLAYVANCPEPAHRAKPMKSDDLGPHLKRQMELIQRWNQSSRRSPRLVSIPQGFERSAGSRCQERRHRTVKVRTLI